MNLNRYRDNEDSTWRHCQRVVQQGVGVGIQNWIAAHVLVGEGNATIISLSTCSFQFFFPFCSIVILWEILELECEKLLSEEKQHLITLNVYNILDRCIINGK